VAITTIQVAGSVVGPDGSPVSGGHIDVALSPANATVDDAGVEQVVAPDFPIVIASTGAVLFDIIPTQVLTLPSGGIAIYRAEYFIEGGGGWVSFWVPTGTASIALGDMPLVLGPVPGALRYFVVTSVAGLPTPQVGHRQSVAYLTGGTGVPDAFYRCMKGVDPQGVETYSWVVQSEG